MTTEKHARPFLKWAGNKYKVLPQILKYVKGNTLVEPFMGSGSLMLNRPTEKYIGADINKDLISVFTILQQAPEALLEETQKLFTQERFDMAPTEKHTKPGESSFYAARNEFNETTDILRKAALFIFLNQHCFNGLCRYNKYGQFTTPYNLGFTEKKRPAVLMLDRYEKAIEMTKGAQFLVQSFEDTMVMAEPGDVIYCDPPYLPQDGKEGTFTQYAEGDFTFDQQKLIVEIAEELRDNNITTIISNHNSSLAREIYKNADIKVELDVKRSMGRYAGHENSAKELLVVYGG